MSFASLYTAISFSCNRMPSTFKDIISQLIKQQKAIERAIAALEDVGEDTVSPVSTPAPVKRGRPQKASKKSTLSSEARERIAAAQRKRWAAQKKAVKKAPVKKGAAKKAAS
jgi:hypothetical protein